MSTRLCGLKSGEPDFPNSWRRTGRTSRKANEAAERLISSIPRDLHMYDEPAHIFRATQGHEHD